MEHAAGTAGADSVPRLEAPGAACPALSEDSTHSHISFPQAKTRWPVTCDKVRRVLAEWRLGWGLPGLRNENLTTVTAFSHLSQVHLKLDSEVLTLPVNVTLFGNKVVSIDNRVKMS